MVCHCTTCRAANRKRCECRGRAAYQWSKRAKASGEQEVDEEKPVKQEVVEAVKGRGR